MISFYPGPSRIYDTVPTYVQDAAKAGIMSINHRSDEFVTISRQTISLLRRKLQIPDTYTILFTSSATECWEIIAQSLSTGTSYHYYNGAFGQKWFEYTHRLRPDAIGIPFDREQQLDPARIIHTGSGALICITQNETSNGTQVVPEILTGIRRNNPGHLVAVDATSSLGGLALDFTSADVWFASVQKCLGMPAGMALLILSPAAVQVARTLNERNHYNSLPFMLDMMDKWQTPYTPNVLSIYLLMRLAKTLPSIIKIQKELQRRKARWEEFIDHSGLEPLIKNKAVRSTTVIPLKGTEAFVQRIKKEARKNGFLLGEGYGDLKGTTFRIANFPAIRNSEIDRLIKFLRSMSA